MMDKLYLFCCVNYPSVYLSELFELDTWMGIICLLEMVLRRHRFIRNGTTARTMSGSIRSAAEFESYCLEGPS